MNTLYLAWWQPDHRWWPVGRLSREGSDYVFTYTQGARSAEEAGFRPLSSFPDFDQVYVSTQLFPMFQNRLPPQSRPDYEDFIEWLDLERGEADPLVMLARSGGQRETDMFEVFPIPERSAEGRYRSTFLDVHALLSAAGEQAEVRVQRVNPPPTPAQFRVLCSLDSPWPEGFRPLASPDFEALHSFAPAGRS